MPKQSENKKDGSWTSDHKFTVCRFLLQKRQAGPPPTSYLLTPYTPFHPSQPFLSLTQFNTFYFPFFLTLPFLYSIQYISFSSLVCSIRNCETNVCLPHTCGALPSHLLHSFTLQFTLGDCHAISPIADHYPSAHCRTARSTPPSHLIQQFLTPD